MNSAKQVDQLIDNWKKIGMTKAEIVIATAKACMEWPYVWGAVGAQCTVEKRRYYISRSAISSGDVALVKKRCQQLRDSNPKATCNGCKYFPNGERVRINDCQGFVKQMFKAVGIMLKGAGCTSMWKVTINRLISAFTRWSKAYERVGSMSVSKKVICRTRTAISGKRHLTETGRRI